MKKSIVLTVCFWGLLFVPLFATEAQNVSDLNMQVSKAFAELDAANKYTDQLSYADMNVLPIGMKQTVSNNTFTVALSNVRLYEKYAEVTVFARMDLVEAGRKIYFAGQGIKFSYTGSIIGDASLALIEDVDIPVNAQTTLTLKGQFSKETGRGEGDLTRLTIDCSGFKELAVNGALTFSSKTFQKTDEKGTPTDEPVRAEFQTIVTDWNDLMVDISLPPFMIKGLDGFIFNIQHAVFDFSDLHNSANIKFPDGYATNYLPPKPELWRGVYAQQLTVTLPKEFAKDGNPASFGAENLLIDGNGVSGMFMADNVLPIEVGNASGWAFSIDKFWLTLEAHKVTKGGFEGLLGLPISEKTYLGYKADILGNNNYNLVVNNKDTIAFDALMAQVKLSPNSSVTMTMKDGSFKPEANLTGYMSIQTGLTNNAQDQGGTKAIFNNIEFRQLKLRTENPYLSVQYMGYDGEIKLLGFPVSVSKIDIKAPGNQLELGFDMALNLDERFVSAKTRFIIAANYSISNDRGVWKYGGVSIGAVKLDNCNIAGIFKLNGELQIMDKDPLYGDGFYGSIKLDFLDVAKGLKIDMSAAFGRKDDERYWFVDGMVGLPVPIPVVAPVTLTGLGGGLSYGMRKEIGGGLGLSKTGCGYIPDKSMGLGLKAAVLLGTTGNFMGGDASFEVLFNRHGGLDLIAFYGYAEFMAEIPGLGDVQNKLSGMYNQLIEKESKYLKSHGGLADVLTDLKQNNSSEAAKILTDSEMRAQKANMAASVGIRYSFSEKTLHANFDFYVNIAGGVVRGTASNNRAGYGVLHISPQKWYVCMGRPDDQIGLQIGIPKIATVTAKSYFMMGDDIPGSPPPPDEVANILRENKENYNYMRDLNALKSGKGIAFGASLEFKTGDLQFLILYANFQTKTGFDIMLRDYGDAQCKGRSGPIGVNGWYANGQAYSYMKGELGVKVNLWAIKGKFPIISGGAAAILQAKLPNPTWFKGSMGVDFNLLSGLVKGNMRFRFSFGEECEIVLPGSSPIDVLMISDLTPLPNASEVDVFTAPQLALSTPVKKEFDVSLDDGPKKYRISLNKFIIKDGNTVIPAEIEWNKDNTVATLYSHEILPPKKTLKVEVAVGFEEFNNNTWKTVYSSGIPAVETRDISFTTGEAPNYVPLHNIVYSYPVIEQQYYFPKESTSGYVQLKWGQSYLFPSNWKYEVLFAKADKTQQAVSFSYSEKDKRLSFAIPNNLSREQAYSINFVSKPLTKGTQQTQNKMKETILLQQDGNTVKQISAKANQVVQEGEGQLLLDYTFATSKYNTFKDKISGITKTGNLVAKAGPYIYRVGHNIILAESFDGNEIYGTKYTGDEPLVAMEAILTDKYYKEDIYKLIYFQYPVSGNIKLSRDGDAIGIPPVFGLSRGEQLKALPFWYELPKYYISDFTELRTKVVGANVKDHPLLNTKFKDIANGSYKVKMRYRLPGFGIDGKPRYGSSSVDFNYDVNK